MDLVTFPKEILNEKLHFLFSVLAGLQVINPQDLEYCLNQKETGEKTKAVINRNSSKALL